MTTESIVRAVRSGISAAAVMAAVLIPLLLLSGCESSRVGEDPDGGDEPEQEAGNSSNVGVEAISRLPAKQAAIKRAHAAPAISTTQLPCPAINFQTAQQLNAGPSQYIGAQRQADGSFTEPVYTANTTMQAVTKTGSVANIQQAFIACAGLSSRARTPVTPHLDTDPLGTPARNPVWADLAGDGVGSIVGFTDLVNPTEVLVQRANADVTPHGSFAAYGVGPSPNGVLAGDFNGDGKKDIAVVYTGQKGNLSGIGGISLLLGNGDGTLQPAINISTEFNAFTAAAYDFNGDGKVDIAVGHYNPGDIEILMGSANGLTPGATYSIAGQNPIQSIAAADLNNDKKGDIVALVNSTLYILYGQGDGTFQNGPTISAPTQTASLGVGDFNKDGIADIALLDSGSGIAYILLGQGNGNYAAPAAYATGAWGQFYTANFFVEDFDGDGNLDLVAAAGHPDFLTQNQYAAGVVVLFGNGDGTFAAGSTFAVNTSYLDQSLLPTNIVAADFNGDGKPDLATSNTTGGSVSVALGKGGGAFSPPVNVALGTVQPTAIAAGAFTGSGLPDIVVTDGASNIEMLANSGSGTFGAPVPYPTGGTSPNFVVTGDFNHDGKLDVAVANSGSGTIATLLGNGDRTFGKAVTAAVGQNPVSLAVGDFNGDGKLDLAVANAGAFSTTGSNPGSVSVLLGKGDGTFQPAVSYAAYNYPQFIATADVNGDGNLDLLVASRGANGVDQLEVLLGSSSGQFQAPTPVPTATGVSWISVADYNGDGKPDLIVAHCCNMTTITALAGNGDGTFQAEAAFGTGPYFSLASADFNGDGKPDLAYTSFWPGWPHTVTALLNISIKPVSQGTLTITSAAGNPIKAPPIAAYSIATAKGSDLATGVVVNTAANPPTTLGNTTVAVQDAAGVSRPAQLFYVSSGQVNFLIPQATALGNATVTITSGDGRVSVGTVAITAVAPAIFTLNSNSLAAAYLQIVHSDGTQTIDYLYAVDATGNVTFPPVSLGSASDQAYLNIYGTGIQGRSSLNGVSITVAGVSTPALYAGASTYPGEDQVVILLPHSLAGSGTVSIQLSADGNVANTTTLNIQ